VKAIHDDNMNFKYIALRPVLKFHSNLSAFFIHINLHNKIIPRRTTHININADIDEIMKVDDDGRFILGTKELQR
jgi:hypothetical protein